MKKVCFILCAALFLLSFCGCSSNGGVDSSSTQLPQGIATDDSSIIVFPADITDVSDFKCVCSYNDSEDFVVDGKEAKELYTVITEAYRQSEKAEFQVYDGDYLYLSFQTGKTDSEKSGDYYGCFSLFENDYLSFSAAPMLSFAKHFKMPEDTYVQVLDLVSKYSK